jgi:MFS transporter, Spinster family, sphingosine-1-phosphate transporter
LHARAHERVSTYAWFALGTLTLLNLLNYTDRYIFAALIPYIKQSTGYSDEQLGWVGSAFTYVYTICSPLFGYLGDRYRRGRLIAFGITIWSLATAAAGLAANFIQLLISRSAVGIGEANYATIAPGLLSDFFVKSRRGLVMSIFFATIPLGTAVGYVMGGYFGAPERLGWRHTLYLVGLPGLLTAFMAYTLREPKRGAMDDEETGHNGENAEAPPSWVEGYKILLSNRGYLLASFGYAATTFALGALVFWAPEWLKTDKGMSAAAANNVLGVCAIIGGFVGTMAGGLIGDWLSKRIYGAFFWICGGSGILAAFPMLIAIVSDSRPVYLASIFITMTLVFLGNGPVNALLVNLVPANLRTTALGLVVVIIHVLGDGISLSMVGSISTWLSKSKESLPGFVVTLGQYAHLNPRTQTLSMALLLMPLALLVSSLFYAAGLRTREARRA